MTLGAIVGQLGLPQSLLRRAATHLIRNEDREARREIRSALVVGGVAAFTATGLLASPVGVEVLSSAFPKSAVASVALLIGVRLGLRIVETILPEAFRAFRDYMRATLYGGVLINLMTSIAFGALFLFAVDVTVKTLLIVTIGVAVCGLVPGVIAVRAKLRPLSQSLVKIRNPIEPTLWFAMVGSAVVAQLDLLVVGALGTSRDAALYAAPFRMALLAGLPLIAVNQVMTPLIAGWHASKETGRLERSLRGTAGVAVIVAGVIALVYVAAGKWALSALFNSTHEGSYRVLVILVVGQVAQTWCGSCGLALIMSGHHKVFASILGISAALTAVLDAALFPELGIEGVAIATTLMLVIQNAANMIAIRRLASIRTTASPRLAIRGLRDLHR